MIAEDRDLDRLEAAEQQLPLPAVAELVGETDAADRQGEAGQHLVGADHHRRRREDDAGERADQHPDGEREERVAGVRPDDERGHRAEAQRALLAEVQRAGAFVEHLARRRERDAGARRQRRLEDVGEQLLM